MADVIRIKRRVSPGSNGAPSSLANAELAYNENDHTLYIGEGTGGAGGSATVIVPIGGTGLAPLASPTFTGTPAAPTAPNGTNTTQIATTAYVLATRIDQLQPPNTDVSWASHRITGLLDPSGAQ